jgi:L-ascorbate metabolism protein UlaG (beta-lactamase superfamily)
VCRELPPYLGTPQIIRERLVANPPDVVAFTHKHDDHCDDTYAEIYKQKAPGSYVGPESFPVNTEISGVGITSVQTRHIGKADIAHVSYIIEGSACVWFMGDASPLMLRRLEGQRRPDIIVVPFAYAMTESALRMTKETGAKDIVLVHMPKKENDPDEIWSAVEKTTENTDGIYIPELGEILVL